MPAAIAAVAMLSLLLVQGAMPAQQEGHRLVAP
jgi:hypothetical protein